MTLPDDCPVHLQTHESKGSYVTIKDGVKVFVRDEGNKDSKPIVMVHGVPASSFLYERMFQPFLDKGYRAISFDFPGLGLSDKPKVFDYSWKGLKDAMAQVIDELQLDSVHLVIHDIGGPISLWYTIENVEKVSSITFLDTMANLETFSKPFPMNLLATNGMRNVVMKTFIPSIMKTIFSLIGVADSTAFSKDDAKAWLYLLKNNNGQDSFFQIMKGFIQTKELQDKFINTIQEHKIPTHVIWGKGERSIPTSQKEFIIKHFNPTQVDEVKGRHFLQLDSPVEIATIVSEFVNNLK